MKKKESSNHHMGKRTGCELINGEYHVAPLYRQQFDYIAAKKQGINEIINMVTSHFAEDLKKLNESAQRIWDDIADDLGINKNDGWYYSNGVVRKQDTVSPQEGKGE